MLLGLWRAAAFVSSPIHLLLSHRVLSHKAPFGGSSSTRVVVGGKRSLECHYVGTGDRHEQAHGARGPSQDDGRDSPHFRQQQAQHGQLQRPHPGSLWLQHTHTHAVDGAPAVTWHVAMVMSTYNWTYGFNYTLPLLTATAVQFLCRRQTSLAGGGKNVRSSLPSSASKLNFWTQYFDNEWTDFDASWYKWSTWQVRETVNCGVKRSKVKVIRGRRYI